jgi:hypothetical protein
VSAPALLILLAALGCILAAWRLLAAAAHLSSAAARLAEEAHAARAAAAASSQAADAARDRELAALRELAPLRIREFLAAAQAELLDCCTILEDGFQAAGKEIERCNAAITGIQDQGDWHAAEIAQLAARRDQLQALTRTLRPGLRALQQEAEFPEPFSLRIPRIRPDEVRSLGRAYLDLAGRLGLDDADAVQARCERVAQAYRHRLDESTLFSESLNATPEGPTWQRPENGE